MFKTGAFYYPDIENRGEIIREKNYQKAYFDEEKMWVYWKISWQDDCSYELTFWKAENDNGYFKVGDRIFVRITAIDKKCYSFISVFYSDKSNEPYQDVSAKMCLK